MEQKGLKSIIVIALGFTIIGLVIEAEWPFYVAITVSGAAVLSDRAAAFINKIWFGLAKVLGFINSRILLTIIYYLFLLPLAIISRMTGKKSIELKKNDASYFVERNHPYSKADLENPW